MKLSERILDQALRAAKHHGYGTFFPAPPEFKILTKNWRQIKTELSHLDLDTYNGYPPIRSFSPKSRVAVRRVVLLHPYDFILYTALALSLRDCIAASRLPADTVFSYRTKFSDSEGVNCEEIAARLLDPILNIRESRASEFYCAWVLSIFQENSVWGNADTLLRIFRETNSEVIRRSAALAIAVCGTRAQAVTVKEYLGTASSLSRTAMLLATAKLGKDERKYLKNSLRLEDEFESLCANAAI